MLDLRLYIAQRGTGLLMIPLTLGHLAVMVYAIQGGLSAEEILARTRGSVFWFVFYGTFACAVSVHGAIGLRVIVHEMLRVRGVLLDVFTFAVGLILLTLGARAAMAVTMS